MFSKKIKKYVKLIEEHLLKILPKLNYSCSILNDAIIYGVLNGGKRFRPILTLAFCEMFEENVEKAIYFACAVELIHAGSLIHDDLPCLDNDKFRRNQLSCHAKFGETAAILAGDGLFLSAFSVLKHALNFGVSSTKIVDACCFLSEMSGFNGMVLGQTFDMFLNKKSCNVNDLNFLASLKTSALIKAACVLGAMAAGVNFEIQKKIENYAEFLGLAFQIYDDLADVKQGVVLNENKLHFCTILGTNCAEKLAIKNKQNAINILNQFPNNEFLLFLTNLILKLN